MLGVIGIGLGAIIGQILVNMVLVPVIADLADIPLAEGVAELGGLHVIATCRNEARRIDRQLLGRCARQGDPGASQFFISFEDDLMRNFAAADRMTSMMERFTLIEGMRI